MHPSGADRVVYSCNGECESSNVIRFLVLGCFMCSQAMLCVLQGSCGLLLERCLRNLFLPLPQWSSSGWEGHWVLHRSMWSWLALCPHCRGRS